MRNLMAVPCQVCDKIMFVDLVQFAQLVEQHLLKNPGKKIEYLCSPDCHVQYNLNLIDAMKNAYSRFDLIYDLILEAK